MSLTTLLLAFLPAIVRPKPEPEKSARERELKAELERAWERNERAAGRIRELEAQLEQFNRLERIPERASYQSGEHACQMAQYLQAQRASMAQYRQQLAGLQQMGFNQALAQSQAYQLSVWHDCTCVPARHDAFFGALSG